MKKKYVFIGFLALISVLVIGYNIFINALSGTGNPIEAVTVKKIVLPKGVKLTYEEQFFKEGQQDKIMNEKKLTNIFLPSGKTIDWGGVPISSITKFFNSEMIGYSVYANFGQLSNEKRTKFSELWQPCGVELGVLAKYADDWTFDTKKIIDISSCSASYQRYFKEDDRPQKFLNSLYCELEKQAKTK